MKLYVVVDTDLKEFVSCLGCARRGAYSVLRRIFRQHSRCEFCAASIGKDDSEEPVD